MSLITDVYKLQAKIFNNYFKETPNFVTHFFNNWIWRGNHTWLKYQKKKKYSKQHSISILEDAFLRSTFECQVHHLPSASFSISKSFLTPLYMSWTHCTSERPKRLRLLMSNTPASSPVDSECSPWIPRAWRKKQRREAIINFFRERGLIKRARCWPCDMADLGFTILWNLTR